MDTVRLFVYMEGFARGGLSDEERKQILKIKFYLGYSVLSTGTRIQLVLKCFISFPFPKMSYQISFFSCQWNCFLLVPGPEGVD